VGGTTPAMKLIRTAVPRALLCVAALLAVACGDSTPHVQQAAATPLTEASVSLKQTGNAPVKVQPGVSYRLDDARLLEVSLTVHSTAGQSVTVSVHGSFFDKAGKLIGDATGSQLDVAPGSDVQVKLSGPAPNGTIAAATYEVTTIPTATPVSK